MNKLRVPPHDLEAEQAVLGCCIQYPNALSRCLGIVAPVSFYKTAHTKIFLSILKVYNRGDKVDLITTIDQLKKDKNLDTVGGAYYISGLGEDLPSAENVTKYAKLVREKYMMRTVISASTEMVSLAYDCPEGGSAEVLAQAEQRLFSLSEFTDSDSFFAIEDILNDTLDEIGYRKTKPDKYMGVKTHYPDIDEYLVSMRDSNLYIVAGRPGTGKTALAMNIAMNQLKNGSAVGVFSLEMSRNQLMERLLVSEGKLNNIDIQKGRFSDNEWKTLTNSAGVMSEYKLFIDDTPGINIYQIRSKARRMVKEHNVKAVYIDYLQLILPVTPNPSRVREVGEISRGMKLMAKELNIPVVLLCQLNRSADSRGGKDKRPILSDLRESGSIEQDADVVMFIYREELDNPTEENKGVAEIIIKKNRHGALGTVKMAFFGKYTKFESLDNFTSVEGMPE